MKIRSGDIQIVFFIAAALALFDVNAYPFAQKKASPISSSNASKGAADKLNLPLDVIHYSAYIAPDLETKTFSGTVNIRLKIGARDLSIVELDAKNLIVEGVSLENSTLSFEVKEEKLFVRLARQPRSDEILTLQIRYRGKPTNFVRFFADHIYAVYNTANWMVCHFHPGDKATFDLRLTLPDDWQVAANGNLVEEKSIGGNRKQYFWRQSEPVPPFILGFAAGKFREVFRQRRGVRLRYLTRDIFSENEIKRIFADTPDMLDFFETKAGVAYPGKSYTQVLAAEAYGQELSDFTVMGEDTGKEALADPRDIYVIVHEFAHQWWGNRVSCADWSHFWLNEAMAEFMTAAYREHRFGREEYEDDVEKARASFQRIRNAGRDHPLAFKQPILESQAGGTIVYVKGLLIMHLLRNELGEKAFWNGIKRYTQKHFDGLVDTEDLQKAMEDASGKSLSDFFAQWLYRKTSAEFVARHRLENGEVVVEIEQRQNELATITLDIAVETSRNRQNRRIVLSDRKQEFRFRVAGDLLSVRLDDRGNLPFHIKHERPLEMLLYQIAHEPDVAGRADALRMIQAVGAKSDGQTRARIKSALEKRAAEDKSRLIRKLARDALSLKSSAILRGATSYGNLAPGNRQPAH